MIAAAPTVHVTSRDNPLLKQIRLLTKDPGAYRKLGQIWLEGDHLCSALMQRGGHVQMLVISESKSHLTLNYQALNAKKIIVLPDALMQELSTLESASWIGGIMEVPTLTALVPDAATVVLDRVQDAGNVGSILRSAAAFGYSQIIAIKGTAALWSPKVLRAGMGAHFGLHLLEACHEDDVAGLTIPVLVTSSHQGQFLHQLHAPWPCAWVLGHEGQGVAPSLMHRAHAHVRIPQPGGEESLNVAAAAAICLYSTALKPE
jgi:RNA methyltransferase, TrmH family